MSYGYPYYGYGIPIMGMVILIMAMVILIMDMVTVAILSGLRLLLFMVVAICIIPITDLYIMDHAVQLKQTGWHRHPPVILSGFRSTSHGTTGTSRTAAGTSSYARRSNNGYQRSCKEFHRKYHQINPNTWVPVVLPFDVPMELQRAPIPIPGPLQLGKNPIQGGTTTTRSSSVAGQAGLYKAQHYNIAKQAYLFGGTSRSSGSTYDRSSSSGSSSYSRPSSSSGSSPTAGQAAAPDHPTADRAVVPIQVAADQADHPPDRIPVAAADLRVVHPTQVAVVPDHQADHLPADQEDNKILPRVTPGQ